MMIYSECCPERLPLGGEAQTVDKVERQRSTVNFFAKGQESQKQETKKKIKGKAV